MKKFLCVILTLAIMLAMMAACGKKPEDESITPSTDSGAPTGTTEPTETNEPSEESGQVQESDFRTKSLGDGTCEISGCVSDAAIIEVPEVLFGDTVIGVRYGAFGNCGAEKIILPDTVEYLGEGSFTNCENLKEIELGSGLKTIEKFVFNNCDALKSVKFPEGMMTITDYCFGICDVLEEVYIPESVTEIGTGITFIEMCPNIVIVTPEGSAAEEAAAANNLPVRHP